jgi:hypothetical protein
MGRHDLYLIYRMREQRALAGYHAGHVTAGECQFDSCLAALARYPLERREPGPPRMRRGRPRPLLRWLARRVPSISTHLDEDPHALFRPAVTVAAGSLAR